MIIPILVTQDILDHFAEITDTTTFSTWTPALHSDFNSSISVQTFLASGGRFFCSDFSSSRKEPLPALTFMLSLTICPWHDDLRCPTRSTFIWRVAHLLVFRAG